VEAFAEAAVRAGATIEHRAVTGLEPLSTTWLLRFRDGARAEADAVALAAGAETPQLVRSLGIELPIEPEPRYLFYGEPIAERLLEPLVVALDRRLAAKHLADGRLLASDLSATGDPATERKRWRTNVRSAIAALLPRLELVALPLLVGGTYDVTPDHQPLLGPVPGYESLVVAAGLSGHGFMMAPEIGRGAASWAAGEDPGGELSQLHPDRFARGADLPERRVV
jgi:sarcosine oxidase subunit beta